MYNTEVQHDGKYPAQVGGSRFWGGLVVAVGGSLLLILASLLPLINIPAALLAAVPLALFTARHSIARGVAASALTAVLLAMTLGLAQALASWLQFAVPGVVYGEAVRQRRPAGKTIAAGLMAFLVGTIFSLSLMHWPGFPGAGAGRPEDWVSAILEAYRSAGLLEMLAQAGMNEEAVRAMLTQGLDLVRRLAPGLLVGSSLVVAGGNYLFTRLLAYRQGIAAPLRPLREWQLPWHTSWAVIVGLSLWLGGDFLGRAVLVTAGQNLLMMLGLPLTVLGLAIAAHFAHRWRIAPAWKMVLILLAIFNLPLAALFLAVMGAFDPLVNYRRLPAEPEKEGTE